MDAKHIYDQSTETVAKYLSSKYCAVGNDTSEAQLEDYLFIAEETSAYFLGNALALLDAGAREEEIKTFTENLRRVIKYVHEKAGIDIPPS